MKPFSTPIFCAAFLFLALKIAAQPATACFPPNSPPSDDCGEACVYCNFNGINSQTTGYSPGLVPQFCGSIENDQWLGIIAGCSSATFKVTPSNCTDGNGCQIALYADCGGPSLACNVGCSGCGMTPQSITASNLIPGKSYFLLIDGWAGDNCDFAISVDPIYCVSAPGVGSSGQISAPATTCPNGTATFCLPTVANAGFYSWAIPADASINGEPGPGPIVLSAPSGNCATINFGPSSGQKTVCVKPANACFNGTQVCKTINIEPIPPTFLPPDTLCMNDADQYTLPWGDPIETMPGTKTYTGYIGTALGCDSVVKKTVTVLPLFSVQLPPMMVCVGECVTVLGQQFCETGNFSVFLPAVSGCDTAVNFSLTILDPIAKIMGPTMFCSDQPIQLLSGASFGAQFEKTWRDSSGQVIAMGDSALISEPGTYFLTVSTTSDSLTCTQMDSISIIDGIFADAVAVGDTLGCASPKGVISGTTTTMGATFQWSGPANFTSSLAAPFVYLTGDYLLTVISPSGCTATATTTVLLEDKSKTFDFDNNPAQIDLQPDFMTDIPIPSSIKNNEPNSINIKWKRTFFDLSPACQPRIEDKVAYHPFSVTAGVFQLATGETAPFIAHIVDGSTSTCCGIVRLLVSNTCTLRDTVEMLFVEGCTVGLQEAGGTAFEVLPNPSSGLFQLKNLPATAFSIKLVAPDGRIVLAERIASDRQFSIESAPSGNYLLLLEDRNGQALDVARLVLVK